MFVATLSSSHHLLHCSLYLNEIRIFLGDLLRFCAYILDHSDSTITQILLFGERSLNDEANTGV